MAGAGALIQVSATALPRLYRKKNDRFIRKGRRDLQEVPAPGRRRGLLRRRLPDLSGATPLQPRGHHRFSLADRRGRSEEHTSELQSLMRTSYAVFCLKIKDMNYKIYTSQIYSFNSDP